MCHFVDLDQLDGSICGTLPLSLRDLDKTANSGSKTEPHTRINYQHDGQLAA
jgi:hypothetical protein